jgi:hypothetical protein
MYLGVQLIYYSWTPLKRYFLRNPIQVLLILNVTVCFFGLLSRLLGGAVLVPLFFFVVGMVSIFYMLVKVSVSLFHRGLASFFRPRINVVSWVLFVVQVVTLAWWFSRWGPVVPPELLLEYTQITEMEVKTPREILQVLEGGGNPLWLVAIKTAASVLLVITASCLLYYYFGPGGGPGEGGVAGAVVEYGPALLAGEDRRQVMARLFVAMQQRAHAMPFGAFFVGFVAAPLPEGVPLVFVNAYAGPLMLGWDPSFRLLQHFLDEFYVIGRVQVVPEVIMFARPLTPVLVTNITWDLFCVMTKTFLRVCWDPVNLLDCHKIMYFARYREEWGLPCEVWVHTRRQVFADYLYVNFAGYRC